MPFPVTKPSFLPKRNHFSDLQHAVSFEWFWKPGVWILLGFSFSLNEMFVRSIHDAVFTISIAVCIVYVCARVCVWCSFQVGLLWMMLLWNILPVSLAHKQCISVGICIGVGFLGQMICNVFSFSRKCQNAFKMITPIYTPTSHVWAFLFLPTLSITGLFNCGHSGGDIVESFCSFNFYLLND